jgi:ATP-binding cassette subfamily B protein
MNDKCCILQDDLKDCGVCSLLSVIKYYHGDISKEYLRELTGTTKEGVSALNIVKAARELGFEAYGVKGNLLDLIDNVLPTIAHVIIDRKYPHFVVIYKIDHKKDQIVIMDPAIGFIKKSISDFNSISTNYYLIMKPKQSIPKLTGNDNYYEKIKNIVSRHKQVFITIIIISIVFMIINIVESYQFKLLYENGNSEIKIVFIILFSLLIIKLFFNYLRNNLINLFNIILDKTLVKDAFYHIINLPYLYYRNHTNGDLLTRINDLGNVKDLISNLFVSIFVDLSLAIIILIVMININPWLSLITFTSLILYGLVVFISSKIFKKIIRENYQHSSLVNNYLVESLSSFETIKNLSIQSYVYKKFLKKYDDYSNNLKYLIRKVNNEDIFKNIFLSIGNLLIIYVGVLKINSNELSLSSLITYMSLSNYLIDPIRNILNLHLKYQNFKESISRIKEINNIPREKEIVNNRINVLRGTIIINNLSYSYNGIDNIIKNISFEIMEGEKVLIYGNSGSGKSTLVKLLIKYLDNNYQGEIRVGGYDLKKLDIFSLRNNICYVSQNEYLYTDSVYENITLGRKIKYNNFLDVTSNLFVDEIVKNSTLGYNYVIENNGENISGGERKRIIIARSVFQPANIYIYDESFSEIDVEREREILKYLFKLYPKKTFIIISHRFSNVDLFNKKIKVGDGKYEFVK